MFYGYAAFPPPAKHNSSSSANLRPVQIAGESTLHKSLCPSRSRPSEGREIADPFSLRSVFAGIANREVCAVWLVTDQRAHARFRIHHKALRKLHADFFGLQ